MYIHIFIDIIIIFILAELKVHVSSCIMIVCILAIEISLQFFYLVSELIILEFPIIGSPNYSNPNNLCQMFCELLIPGISLDLELI
jgi:hypothetical protein